MLLAKLRRGTERKCDLGFTTKIEQHKAHQVAEYTNSAINPLSTTSLTSANIFLICLTQLIFTKILQYSISKMFKKDDHQKRDPT